MDYSDLRGLIVYRTQLKGWLTKAQDALDMGDYHDLVAALTEVRNDLEALLEDELDQDDEAA